MISRRSFVGTSLSGAASLLPALSRRALAAPAHRTLRPTPATLPFNLVNRSASNTVYAYVTGLAMDNRNRLMLLRADGRTPYYPPSPPRPLTPLGADCAIRLGARGGAPKRITVPHLAGGRLWFSIGKPLTFLVNPGPALVQPSVTNPDDPNANVTWDFCEFTYDHSLIYANISYVDFVCVPIALSLASTSGTAQTVRGLRAGGLDAVCTGLKAQAQADRQGWDKLVVTRGGQNLRALSPYNGMVRDRSLFSGYYHNYVARVWQKYQSATLTIDTQVSYGNVTGHVSGGQLTFGGIGSFAAPTTADIFSCSTGPFNSRGLSGAMLAILPRLAAAFNRTTLLIDSNQPNGEQLSTYYAHSPTNHYARIVHANEINGLGYAFPYDDVAPTGGVNQSGFVASGKPTLLTVTVGPVH